jgi:hypothetical protein
MEGAAGLAAKLRRLAAAAEGVSSSVVYTAPYALFVHEDLEARHAVGGAKYLERPAREHAEEIAAAVAEAAKDGTLEQAVLAGAEALLAFSQDAVPVATGALKLSGSVEVDGVQ